MFGKKLKSLRISYNLTQKELGNRLNLSQRVIGYYEKEDRFPDQKTLINIADFFDVSTDYLLGRSENEKSFNFPKDESDIEKILNLLLENKELKLNGKILDSEKLKLLSESIKPTINLLKKLL